MITCFVTRNHREPDGKLFLYGNIVEVNESKDEIRQMLRAGILRMVAEERNKSEIKITAPVEERQEIKQEKRQEIKRKRGRPKKVKAEHKD